MSIPVTTATVYNPVTTRYSTLRTPRWVSTRKTTLSTIPEPGIGYIGSASRSGAPRSTMAGAVPSAPPFNDARALEQWTLVMQGQNRRPLPPPTKSDKFSGEITTYTQFLNTIR